MEVESDNGIKENNLFEMKDYNERNKLGGWKKPHFFTLFTLLIHEIETLMVLLRKKYQPLNPLSTG